MSGVLLVIVRVMCYISTMNTTHIYTLSHPETGVIRYVGKANQLGPRYALHLRKDEATAKSRWIQSLKKKGLAPKMEVLDVVPTEQWQFWEVYWISQLKAWGCTLYNGDNGGLGTGRLPNAVKQRISDTLRGRPQPQKRIQYNQYTLSGQFIASHASAANAALAVSGGRPNIVRSARDGQQAYGYVWQRGEAAPATILTRYDSAGHIILSADTRAKLSKASSARIYPPCTDETRAKMRSARLGKSPGNKGVPQTEAQRAATQLASTTKKTALQYSLDGQFIKEWPSMKAAAAGTGATRAGILNTIKGKNKHAAGFLWYHPEPYNLT